MPSLEPIKSTKISTIKNFEPSIAQRMAKAQFWAKLADTPNLTIDDDTPLDIIARLACVNVITMKPWFGKNFFHAWFMNKDQVKHRLNAAAELAIDALTEILENKDPKSSNARVKAAELVLKYAGYEPPPIRSVLYADADIQKMNEAQLKNFLDVAQQRKLHGTTEDK